MLKKTCRFASLLAIILYFLLAAGILADTETEDHEDADESNKLEEIVVRAHPLSSQGMVGDVLVVSASRQDNQFSPTSNLGQTVEQLAGTRNASFGEGVGQVVIHGLDGPRVMYLYDRLQTMDAALSSRDHPPMMEPIIADQIEVLKGPSTLLYGSGSSGGIVNLESGRIPRDLSADYPEYILWLQTRDNSRTNSGAFRLKGNNDRIAFHVDYFYRAGDFYDIPACAESKYLMAEEDEHDHEDEDEDEHDDNDDDDHEPLNEENCGTLIDSDVKLSQGGALGLSFIGDWGYTGMSVSTVNATMGIPIEHHHDDHDHEEDQEHGHEHEDEHEDEHDDEHDEEGGERERVYIDLYQNRFDWELVLFEPLEILEDLEVRFASSDYEHQEIAGELTETTYRRTNTADTRIVLTTKPRGNWKHAFGFQNTVDDFTFTSLTSQGNPTTTVRNGLFWLGNREIGNTDYQLGLRWDVNSLDNRNYGKFDFGLLSASGAVVHEFSNGLGARLALDYSSRAPLAEELFVEGTHLFTGSALIPNLDLEEENMIATSVALNYDHARWAFNITGYFRTIDNFLYEAPTGEIEHGLPVYQFVEHDATFFGADVSVEYQLVASPNWEVNTTFIWDTVHSEIHDGPSKYLPRTPSNRTRLGINFLSGRFWGRVEIEHNGEVTEVPAYILPTDAYSDVSIDLEYEIIHADVHAAITLGIRNLFDEEQRPHTSAIKDLAPLPGRTIELGFTMFN
ncbi:MAG: TonB-dependent receptor [Gammaproteobacteria bacterium]|nr:TonB-dependent receptor [Gammaproteobacteria bacterium]